ncbi:MAG: hypothetical protein WCQ21_19775 [Verrucomicrobiota bacterium]
MSFERKLRDLINQAYALTPTEIELRWQTAPPPRNLITLSSPAAKVI